MWAMLIFPTVLILALVQSSIVGYYQVFFVESYLLSVMILVSGLLPPICTHDGLNFDSAWRSEMKVTKRSQVVTKAAVFYSALKFKSSLFPRLWSWFTSERSFRALLPTPLIAAPSGGHDIQKEIKPEYSLEGLMLKMKLQYFGHLMQRTDSFEKTLMLGNIEGGRRRGRQRTR